MNRLAIGSLVFAAACAPTTQQADPAVGVSQAFRTGVCPSNLPIPDTLGPLKISRTRVRRADAQYEPTIGPIFGHVLARMTIDTTGRVEPGSVVVVTSDNPQLSVAYCRDLLRQRFVPYRVDEIARRVRVDQDFRTTRAPGR